MKLFDHEDLLYAAGFIDGEGCFSVDNKWKVRVSCANSNRPVVEWFKSVFGGSICRATRLRSPKHRRIFSWCVVSGDAEEFCRSIVVYLRVKQEECLLAIAIRQTIDKRKKPSYETILERKFFASRMKDLKHVSWD